MGVFLLNNFEVIYKIRQTHNSSISPVILKADAPPKYSYSQTTSPSKLTPQYVTTSLLQRHTAVIEPSKTVMSNDTAVSSGGKRGKRQGDGKVYTALISQNGLSPPPRTLAIPTIKPLTCVQETSLFHCQRAPDFDTTQSPYHQRRLLPTESKIHQKE